MTPENINRVQSAHAEAVTLPPAERENFLRGRFPDEPELLNEARELLHCWNEAGDFMATPLIDRFVEPDDRIRGRVRVGPYELIRELGHGGAASVYLARRADNLFEKQVAIKILNRLSHSRDAFLRFQREIQVLARVEHTYIVRLLEAGTTSEALAYIVTELVEGENLDRFAARLPIRERLQLFAKVCEGVSAAHRNLVVHRDLKPSNILVTADGTPKLLDFGIAVLLDDDSRLTQTGLERMTVYYASPEQLRGDKVISTASDVYSLGVLLYEMISGAALLEAAKQNPARIRPEDPLPLENVRRELRAVVQKATQAEPGARYESVERLRDDVKRFLDGEPVSAHGHGRAYTAIKFARKHWLFISAVLVSGLLLATLAVVSVASSREAKRQSARIKELLSNELDKISADGENRVSLRGLRSVGEVRTNYLTALAAEYPNDLQIALLRFGASRRLGAAQGLPFALNLGETTKARDNFAIAVNIGEEILARWPEGAALRGEVALTYLELGSILVEMDEQNQAKAKFDRADMLSDSDDAGVRHHLEVLAQRSRLLIFEGRSSEALLLRRQVVDERRKLFEKAPESIRWEFAGALCSYGHLLKESERLKEAEGAYAEALPMIHELVRRDPQQLNNSWHLARESEEYAKVLLSLGRAALARKHLDIAISLHRAIQEREPDAVSNKRALAMCLDLLGLETVKKGDRRLGRLQLEEALRLSEPAAKSDPGSALAQQEVATIRNDLAKLGQ